MSLIGSVCVISAPKSDCDNWPSRIIGFVEFKTVKGGERVSPSYELRALDTWTEQGTLLELVLFSFSKWPLWRHVRIKSFIDYTRTLELIEDDSKRMLPPLDLEGAILKWADAKGDPPPFVGVSPQEFKSFLFMGLNDGKHLVMAERRLPYRPECNQQME